MIIYRNKSTGHLTALTLLLKALVVAGNRRVVGVDVGNHTNICPAPRLFQRA